MRKKGLLDSVPCRVPEMDSNHEYVIASAQLIQAQGKEILNIDLFWEGTRKARYFADKEVPDWAVYDETNEPKWKKKRLRTVCREIMRLAYWEDGRYEWSSERERDLVNRYVETYSVDFFEDSIASARKEMAARRKMKRIADLFRGMDPVPERAKQWLDEEVFPENYLFVQEKGDRSTYTCTKCGKTSWTARKFKQYGIVACPKCGEPVKVEKSASVKCREQPVVTLQPINSPEDPKYVERQFEAECEWDRRGKRIKLFENIRCLIPKGHQYGNVYYGTRREAEEDSQIWWDKKRFGQVFRISRLYPYSLHEVLPWAKMDHSGMEILAEKGIRFNVNNYILIGGSKPYLEYLIKAGMTKMATDIINDSRWHDPTDMNPKGKNLKEVLKLDGNRAARMREINGSFPALKWLQREQQTGEKVTQEALEYLEKHRVGPSDTGVILKELGSVTRMVNYMKKQSCSPKRTIEIWKDYLRMSKREGLNLQDDIVRLPKDLKARHDDLVEVINKRRDRERLKRDAEKYRMIDANIRRHIEKAERYYWQNAQYIIVPAAKCEELVAEGRRLHHCVGASDLYMNKMAEGKSWILFLRRKAEPEKPYYTIEIDMNTDELLQWYSEYDRKPDKEKIRKVLSEFKQNLKRERVRTTA